MTIWEIATWSAKDIEQFAIHCGNFLDEFYRSSPEQRQCMINQEPDADDCLPDHILPFLAGMVHKLCNDYAIACPNWIHKDCYVLNEPHFWLDAKGTLRFLLLVESPIEFKIRNLFVAANALTRV